VKNVRSFDSAIGFWSASSNKIVVPWERPATVSASRDGDSNLVDSASSVSGSTSHGAQLTSTANQHNTDQEVHVHQCQARTSSSRIREHRVREQAVLQRSTASGDANLLQVLQNLAGDRAKGNGLNASGAETAVR
jgi:hypothetical protein